MFALDLQWLDTNSQRNFPLYDLATRLDITGLFTLPNDLICDAKISAPSSYGVTGWFVSQVTGYGSGLVITLACTGQGNVATVTVPLVGFTMYSSYAISALPGFPQVGGSLVIGSAAAVIASSSSIYNFVQANTQLLPTVIYPAASVVSSVTVVDQFGNDTLLTGAIVLAAGANGSLSVSGQTITLGMTTGVLIQNPCGCLDSGGNNRVPIRTVNGVGPDNTGNLTLVGLSCMGVQTGGTGVVGLNDTCATPCCGSPELTQLATNANTLQTQQNTLANDLAQLQAALNQVINYFGGGP
jgi:hypothetical protein